MKLCWLIPGVLVLATGVALAQRYGRGRGFRGDSESLRTAREVESNSTGTPTWEYPAAFQHDVFTFARIRYQRDYGGGRGWGRGWRRGGDWTTDLPDSDLNLSWRLQQMTSMRVDPNGRIVNLTDPDLADFPFIYIVEPGALLFTEDEVTALNKYLVNGGFLWFDDFWGENAWTNVEEQMKRVLPKDDFTEIPMGHALYHKCIFDIKEKAQVPAIGFGVASQDDGITWEQPDAQEVHHRGIFDEKGRLIVLATHNTDNGDGWEREGENAYYFKQFSEKTAYPLAINVIFYVMTH
jgi:Domain of unknown function (DUF4159)